MNRQENLREKRKFLFPVVLYLGQIVNREDIKPAEENVKSINKAPRPTSVKELQDFLYDSERESKIRKINNDQYS